MSKKTDLDTAQGLDLHERKTKKNKTRESLTEKLRDITKRTSTIEKPRMQAITCKQVFREIFNNSY